MKTCCELASDSEATQILHDLVREQLRSHNITLKPPKKRTLFPVTPMRPQNSTRRVFGRPLRDLAPNTVVIEGCEVTVPRFLSSVLDYLRLHKETEGLFRKAGSAARQKSLRSEIELAETFFVDPDESTNSVAPLDVASLLKTWLRELLLVNEPLISSKFHDALVSATALPEKDKTEVILLCCLMLPPINAASLAYLMRFLAEIADAKEHNKMDARSLAIVFAPCLFPVEEEDVSTKNVDKKNSLESKVEVVRTLISNASRISVIDEMMETALNLPTFVGSQSEDNLDDVNDAQGPSARRRKKRKRRSGSLSRVLSATMRGLSKAISRSTTPSGPRTAMDSSNARTPYEFASPSIVPSVKGSRTPDFETSPSKHVKSSFEVTPKVVRHRSISIKNRFKRKKSLPGKVKCASACNTPLPSKPTLASLNLITAATPNSPLALEMFHPATLGQDLSMDNLEKTFSKVSKFGVNDSMSVASSSLSAAQSVDSVDVVDVVDGASALPVNDGHQSDRDDVSMKDVLNSSFQESAEPSSSVATSRASSITSINSIGAASMGSGGRSKKRTGNDQQRRRPRSPSERKIGIVRRRSQEMARRELLQQQRAQQQQQQQYRPNVASLQLPDDSFVRSRLRRGQHVSEATRGRPGPMRVENVARSLKLSTPTTTATTDTSSKLIDKTLNESLTNLRQDISSLIEDSFGGRHVDRSTKSIIADDSTTGVRLQKMTASSTTPKLNLSNGKPSNKNTPKDIVSTFDSSSNYSCGVTTRSGLVRRQSSAFEFSRPETEIGRNNVNSMPGTTSHANFRRQSSAFEITAIANRKETFERSGNRASLKHRNSSVKDLVQKLESSVAAKTSETNLLKISDINKRRSISVSSLQQQQQLPPQPQPVEEFCQPALPPRLKAPTAKTQPTSAIKLPPPPPNQFGDFGGEQFEEQWVDAAEFFNGKSAAAFTLDDDLSSGCKRSSIIRIRNEKIVSKSIETFTRPNAPTAAGHHMATPSRSHQTRPSMATPTTAPRRMSARMGVATAVRTAVPATVATTATSTTTAVRRQTGIRTTPQHTNRRATLTAVQAPPPLPPKIEVSTAPDEPIYSNISKKNSESISKKTPSLPVGKTRLLSDRRHDRPVVTQRRVDASDSLTQEEKLLRKSKRLEGRRHLTIGYDGEVRSPLRERQNVLPSVQRSKSAQTTKLPVSAKKANKAKDEFSFTDMAPVLRSHSLRYAPDNIQVPASLRDTIYDVTTPKSEKVKRQLSDRVVTPKGGRQEAVPYIKTALNYARVNRAAGHLGTTPSRPPRSLVSPSPSRNSPRLLNRY